MIRMLAFFALTLNTSWLMAAQLTVDCGAGQSLNEALSQLNKQVPANVSVKGTCTEYVHIIGFNGLTLKAVPGAALHQPSGGSFPLFDSLLLIESSRSVTIDGFSIQADIINVPAVGIGHGSSDIRLRNLTIQGGTEGIIIFENSQVSIAYVTALDPAYTPLGVYDLSDVHVEHSLFEVSTGTAWHAGMDVESSHVTMYGTTIRNMQVGINVNDAGIVDVDQFNTYYPLGGPSNVVIDSPARTNYYGVSIAGGGSLNLGSARLSMANPGQVWGEETGGVLVTGGSSLNAGASLLVTGSLGQGVTVTNNSHADLDGSNIIGGQHGGLVVVNQSSAAVGSGHPPTSIDGNATDIFCDSRSLITGGANIGGATTVQCANLLPGDTVTLP
ncbi:MAG TPA: right-handed parallel beta-helix repeat-containing protein [Candidatus Sulfotelmatobacter sp.]